MNQVECRVAHRSPFGRVRDSAARIEVTADKPGAEREDPHWRDCIQFYEYLHGDNGAGLGASHQTGWTGVIARAVHLFATVTPEQLLEGGTNAFFDSIADARNGDGK